MCFIKGTELLKNKKYCVLIASFVSFALLFLAFTSVVCKMLLYFQEIISDD